MSYKKLIFNFFIGLFPSLSFGASCCGSGFAVPSIITGDEKAQFTASLMHSEIVADVSSNGVWQRRNDEDINILKLEAAHIFKDRYQAGASVPIQERVKSGPPKDTSTGLSDVSTQVGYEYLTDWNYSSWRPRAVGYLSITFPTGKSIYESDTLTAIDSRGRGFWAIGLGSIFTKNHQKWDFLSNIEAHRSLDKSSSQGKIKPGYGGSFVIGAGYSMEDLRIGTTVGWTYEDRIEVDGAVSSGGAIQRYATATFSLSYLLKNQYSLDVNYSDQTLIDSPTNTSLSRSVAFLVQKKWNR